MSSNNNFFERSMRILDRQLKSEFLDGKCTTLITTTEKTREKKASDLLESIAVSTGEAIDR